MGVRAVHGAGPMLGAQVHVGDRERWRECADDQVHRPELQPHRGLPGPGELEETLIIVVEEHSILAKTLKLFLLAHFSTFHATPHPRINDVGMPFMRGLATPLGLSLIIEPGVRGGRREREKVANFWRRLKGRFAKSQVRFFIF